MQSNLIEPVNQNGSEFERERLPFTIQDVRAAIPKYCFEPSTWKSLAYFGRDVVIVAGLYAIAYKLDSWLFYPVFWFMQATMFWALFVIGHDYDHASYSQHK